MNTITTPNRSSTVQTAEGSPPIFFPADVTDEQLIQDMCHQIKLKYGRLDSVVNCAGIGVAFRTYNINKVSLLFVLDKSNKRSEF